MGRGVGQMLSNPKKSLEILLAVNHGNLASHARLAHFSGAPEMRTHPDAAPGGRERFAPWHPTWPHLPAAALVALASQISVWGAQGTPKLEYNRDIRPILSDRCFKCHGPDKGSRKASLRLDVAHEAYAKRKKRHQPALVPRTPGDSLLGQK